MKIFLKKIKLSKRLFAVLLLIIMATLMVYMLASKHRKRSALTQQILHLKNTAPRLNQNKNPNQSSAPPVISLNLQNTPTQEALQKIASLGNLNLIVNSAVEGEVSLHFHQLPPKEALHIVLTSQQLKQKQIGNTIYISPLPTPKQTSGEPATEETVSHPLQSFLLRLNYANAKTIAETLKNKQHNLLSPQGTIAVDMRTNTLLIQDHAHQLEDLRSFLKKLDIPMPQVSIQARIVSVDSDYEKELGIKIGASNTKHISGSLRGANDIAAGKSLADIPIQDRLNVDLPAVNNQSARLGLALFKLSKGTFLDLELSALESEGHAEIISSPRLVTVNQQPATIEAGEEIPYQESVAQGVTATSFKKAVLRLEVTPQITADQTIILRIKANQDKRGSKEINGVPTIDTRQIDTQVRVENGQTVVLGGIYEHTKTQGIQRVPFFGQLPFVGVLFRNKKILHNRRELLIFVTPKIIAQESS